MAVRHEDKATEAKMDSATLYREEIITDRKVGTLRMLPPRHGLGAVAAHDLRHVFGITAELGADGKMTTQRV